MNPCSGTAPQKRPDPGHSRNRLGSGAPTRAPRRGEITGIIIGLVMMESRMMQDLLARKIRTRKTRRVWKQRARLAALAGALGLIALAGMAGGVAHAQSSSESGLWGSMLKSLGIGGENNIEYRERPPLVVPPTRDLPPPQTTARARDPNWPVDPNSGNPQKKGAQVRDLDRLPVPQRAARRPALRSRHQATRPPPSRRANRHPRAVFSAISSSSGDQPAGPVVATTPDAQDPDPAAARL